jgi:excisionase family DNA binding protein
VRNHDKDHAPGAAGDQLFALAEAQHFLRVGRSTFFDLLKRGAIPYSRIGSRRYIWRSDLAAFVNASRVATDAA